MLQFIMVFFISELKAKRAAEAASKAKSAAGKSKKASNSESESSEEDNSDDVFPMEDWKQKDPKNVYLSKDLILE